MGASRDLRAWLAGAWTVDRSINDDGSFAGRAVLSVRPEGGLWWHETGRLALAGHQGPASRELELVPAGARDDWRVLFDGGRPFHELNLASGRCEVRHDCGDDVYLGVYLVEGPDALSVTWRVSGPGRADEIRSRYERRAGPPASALSDSA